MLNQSIDKTNVIILVQNTTLQGIIFEIVIQIFFSLTDFDE
jgi:hypothetical protein